MPITKKDYLLSWLLPEARNDPWVLSAIPLVIKGNPSASPMELRIIFRRFFPHAVLKEAYVEVDVEPYVDPDWDEGLEKAKYKPFGKATKI
jgi:hypothetical protein